MGQVYCGKIVEIKPIQDADRIEFAVVVCGEGGKWSGVIKKGELEIGSLCRVYLPDSILPEIPEFNFMSSSGYRVKMKRLRGCPSEVLILPLSYEASVGDDLTDREKVIKYQKELPAGLQGDARGNFPSFIPKTDEPNFQSVPWMLEAMNGLPCYITVKYDGSSGTIYKKNGVLGCCSRNIDLKDTPGTAVWQIARKYDVERWLPNNTAIQFEMIGPSIQGNPLKVKELEARAFNFYTIFSGYNDVYDLKELCEENNFPMVSTITWEGRFRYDGDMEALRQLAEGYYPNGGQREGIVIRPMKEMQVEHRNALHRLSFKVINLLYKEK